MFKNKEQYVKIALSEKWNLCASIPLQNLLGAHDCLPLRHICKRMVVYIVKNKIIVPFQVGYVSLTALKQNKAFKIPVETLLAQYLQEKQCNPQKYCRRKITLVFLHFSCYMKTERLWSSR